MIDYSLGYPQQERNSAEHWQDRMKDECPWTIPWMDSIYQKHCVKDTFVTMSSGYRAHAIYLYAHGESEGDHIQMGGTTVGMCCEGSEVADGITPDFHCAPRWLWPFWISSHLKDPSVVALTVCSMNGFQNPQVYLGLTCSGKSYPQGWWPER